ncbi:MAG: hypothetical protein ABSE73_25960 [Planctomycetota bacterium]
MKTTRKRRRAKQAAPQDISEKLLHPITEEEADIILSDPELQAESKRTGIDLGLLVNDMRLTVTERLKQLRAAARFVQAFREAGRKAGLQ